MTTRTRTDAIAALKTLERAGHLSIGAWQSFRFGGHVLAYLDGFGLVNVRPVRIHGGKESPITWRISITTDGRISAETGRLPE